MKLTDACLKQIYAHAAHSYPAECFGYLLGTFDRAGTVYQAVAGTNLHSDPTDRFEMDPQQFVQVDQLADGRGWEVIGFYHSHPDWPAIPSQTDLVWAWENAYYLIVSTVDSHPTHSAVWTVAPNAPRRFVAAPLELVDEAALLPG
jgi:proteasome lid subunit RPN8/RPN11